MEAQTKNCQNCKKDFSIESADFDFYKKIDVPPPTWCPHCRMIRRLLFWNERFFFKKIEKRTGKTLFSMYSPNSQIEIYDQEYWNSDAWDVMSYGKEIDWSRPFLAQIQELNLSIPRPARQLSNSAYSEYSNNADSLKNCYLCFNADNSEDCMYGVGINALKRCFSVFRCDTSEMLYECWGCFGSYNCSFSSFLVNCQNVSFSYRLEDCSDCLGCINLKHAKYQIFNKQYTKEDYEKMVASFRLDTYGGFNDFLNKFQEFSRDFPRRYFAGIKNIEASGDYIRNSKNVHDSFSCNGCENSRYIQSVLMGAKETYDYTNWGSDVQFAYEARSCGGGVSNVKFSDECYGGVTDIEYSMLCKGSSNLFGCVGVSKKHYCILNKQYSKEDYLALIPKIKKHMTDMPYVDSRGLVYRYGEFFPPEFSLFSADETAFPDYVEKADELAKIFGLKWNEKTPSEYAITMPASLLPEKSSDADIEILKNTIGCIKCEKGFRIPQDEFNFVVEKKLPLSRFCPSCRMRNLISLRNFPVFYERGCDCAGLLSRSGKYKNIGVHEHKEKSCDKIFKTSYKPDSLNTIYCESCFQQEMV